MGIRGFGRLTGEGGLLDDQVGGGGDEDVVGFIGFCHLVVGVDLDHHVVGARRGVVLGGVEVDGFGVEAGLVGFEAGGLLGDDGLVIFVAEDVVGGDEEFVIEGGGG